MSSIIPGYEYDIFISYRQKDNKRDGWVTEFIDTLKDEIEATFKEDISIYFDENPHDGLLETHDVDDSLREKLNCLIFIPIVSQTYCDPKCFAWEHEFKVFVELASNDQLGLKTKLAGGNVASRVLPVKIHDLDNEDEKLFESEVDGVMRSIDFIYKAAGVNRPLTAQDDQVRESGKILYRDQVNKVANAVKEIISGIKGGESTGDEKELSRSTSTTTSPSSETKPKSKNKVLLASISIIVILVLAYFFYNNQNRGVEEEIDKSIAVLPFSNTKPDPVTDYLGFAIANQIIGDLVYLKSITVRPSASIRKYEKQAIDPIIIGDDLRVDYLLIGNYLKEANIIRLDVELVEANTNEMIWRESIEVDFNNAFELQDIVAQKVVEGLDVQFSQKELNRTRKDIPDNPLAYEYYLRSISYPLSNEGYQLAIEMLNKSIELDSNYAPAYVELGLHTQDLAQYGLGDQQETKRAEKFYLKALSLNGELLSALGYLAMLYIETGKPENAMELTNQMLKINPNSAEAHFSLGYIYRYTGMLSESIQEMEKAVAIDPKNPRFRSMGLTYLYAGEHEKAFNAFDIDKGSTFSLLWQGTILFRQGEKERAVQYFDRVIALEPEGTMSLIGTFFMSHINNNIKEGLHALVKLEQANLADSEFKYSLASFYGLFGDRDGCIRTLRRAVDGGFFNYPLMLTDSFLDSVRDDMEFHKIVAKAKEKHEAFQAFAGRGKKSP